MSSIYSVGFYQIVHLDYNKCPHEYKNNVSIYEQPEYIYILIRILFIQKVEFR